MEQHSSKTQKLSLLVALAKEGDTDALEELYYRFLPLILKKLKKMKVEYRQEGKSVLIVELLGAVKKFEPNTDWGQQELQKHIMRCSIHEDSK